MFRQPADGGQPEVLHVFARTPSSTTPAHYYRRHVDRRWTHWEKIDLDISERQILPIVWNRRLYLFWPVFTEETVPLPTPIPDKPIAPVKYFRIALAWSEYKRGKWQPKRVTSQTVVSRMPFERGKEKHVLRASIGGDGLYVWYEFDDPTTSATVPGPYGATTWVQNAAEVDGWRFTGCEGRTEPFSTVTRGIFQPSGTSVDGMRFVEQGEKPLSLPKGLSPGDAVALTNTPGRFELMYLHQDGYLTGLRPFFYADDGRTYFVESVEAWERVWTFPIKNTIEPVMVDEMLRHYYQPVIGTHDGLHESVVPKVLYGVSEPVPIARALLETDVAGPAAAARPAVRDKLILAKGDKGLFTIGEYIDDHRIDDVIVWARSRSESSTTSSRTSFILMRARSSSS